MTPPGIPRSPHVHPEGSLPVNPIFFLFELSRRLSALFLLFYLTARFFFRFDNHDFRVLSQDSPETPAPGAFVVRASSLTGLFPVFFPPLPGLPSFFFLNPARRKKSFPPHVTPLGMTAWRNLAPRHTRKSEKKALKKNQKTQTNGFPKRSKKDQRGPTENLTESRQSLIPPSFSFSSRRVFSVFGNRHQSDGGCGTPSPPFFPPTKRSTLSSLDHVCAGLAADVFKDYSWCLNLPWRFCCSPGANLPVSTSCENSTVSLPVFHERSV